MTDRIDPVVVRLELDATGYEPGGELRGVFSLPASALGAVRSVEFSVLWQDKGGSPPTVVHFEGWKAEDGTLARLELPFAFSLKLPRMPWSYEGKWIAIRWLVRVRLRYDESPKRVGEIVRDVSFAMSPTGEPVRPIRGPGSDDDADEDE